MLPALSIARASFRLPLQNLTIEGQENGQVVGLGGWRQFESAPESGDSIPGFATHLSLSVQVYRGEGVKLKEEEIGMLTSFRKGIEIQEKRQPAGFLAGRLDQAPETSK